MWMRQNHRFISRETEKVPVWCQRLTSALYVSPDYCHDRVPVPVLSPGQEHQLSPPPNVLLEFLSSSPGTGSHLFHRGVTGSSGPINHLNALRVLLSTEVYTEVFFMSELGQHSLQELWKLDAKVHRTMQISRQVQLTVRLTRKFLTQLLS